MEEKLKFENPYKYYSYMIEACYKNGWLHQKQMIMKNSILPLNKY